GEMPYALVKDGEAWRLEDASVVPAGFRFDADAARAFVSSVVNTRVADYEATDPGVETTKLGDDADALTFTVTPAAEEGEPAPAAATRTLRLGAPNAEGKSVFG